MDGDQLENLDLTERGDAQLLERAVDQRWGMTEEQRKYAVLKVLDALRVCDNKKGRTIGSLVRTLALLERQNQSDEHHAQPTRGLDVTITADQLAEMTDDQLDALERRLNRNSGDRGV